MKQTVLILALFWFSINIYGQTTYIGYIDQYPIELLADISSDGDVSAIYCYSKFDNPIVISGNLKNKKLTLFEKDKNNKNTASLQFDDYGSGINELKGIWTDLNTKKQLKITLNKSFDNEPTEIMQAVSLDNKYFKLIISNDNVVGVKIVEKKTDKLLQQIDLECQLWGLNNISIGDYNFDGIMDFSVFESSYAGPNTSRLYFLYDIKSKQYFESGFSGVSLEFDSKTKRIHEHNQCCAGTSVTTAEYKVVKNQMVLIKEHCYKWDEKKQSLVERKIQDCQ